MVSNGTSSIGMPSLERSSVTLPLNLSPSQCPKCPFWPYWVSPWTLAFELLTSKCNKFIVIPNCTLVVNLSNFPQQFVRYRDHKILINDHTRMHGQPKTACLQWLITSEGMKTPQNITGKTSRRQHRVRTQVKRSHRWEMSYGECEQSLEDADGGDAAGRFQSPSQHRTLSRRHSSTPARRPCDRPPAGSHRTSRSYSRPYTGGLSELRRQDG